MSPAEFPVRRPITTIMALVAVLVVGAFSFARLPLAYLPDVDVPFIHVEIPRPNASPIQNEKEITKPVEEQLSTLSGVKTLRSTSEADSVSFDLEFRWGQDLDLVRMAVREQLDRVESSLPADRGQIQVFSFSTSDMPVVRGRISAPGIDLSESYDVLETRIVNRLRRLEGVARVELDGVAPRELYIDLVLDAVSRHGISIASLLERLRGHGAREVLGELRDGRQRLTARAFGGLATIEDVRAFPVGNGLRLADIAEIRYEEPPIAYGRLLDRQPAIALRVFKESTANTVEVVRAVMGTLEGDIANDSALRGIEVFVWEDQAEQITAGIEGLQRAGVTGSLFAVACLFFFLRRIGATLIVSLSIPFSIVATFGVLYLSGKSLNMLSMMGLMLGVGMLVDNAIVVLESIERAGHDLEDRKAAAIAGTRQVGVAVFAATATTLIVFLPPVLGASTDLTTWLREIGVAISLSLVCSLFSSLTLIPLLSAHVLGRTAPVRQSTGWTAKLEAAYARLLSTTIRHRWKTAGIALVLVAAGCAPLFTDGVKTAMFSANVHKRLYLEYDFSDFHYKSDARRVVQTVEAPFYDHSDEFPIESLYSFYAENRAGTTINLSRHDLSDEDVDQLREKLRKLIPDVAGVRVYFSDESDGGGQQTQFSVKLFGRDAERLRELAELVESRLDRMSDIEDVHSSYRRGREEIEVRIDRERAKELGIDAQTLSEVFGFTLGGMRLPRMQRGGREIDAWLALRIRDRQRLSDLRRLRIPTSTGKTVELGDLVNFRKVRRGLAIQREARKVKASVSATYEGKDWQKAQAAISEVMSDITMPPGYHWSWDDRILEQDDQNREMAINFALALALVYIVMASLFESVSQPFAILASIIFALPGAVVMLAVTATPFNLMSQIGLLILMGIVVNNGVVLVDRYNQHRRSGVSRDDALVAAGRDRLRAILMTATTTVVGLSPLAFGQTAVGGLFYFPLARTVIGGLVSSAGFTLLILPLLIVVIEAVAEQRRRIVQASWVHAWPFRASVESPGPSASSKP